MAIFSTVDPKPTNVLSNNECVEIFKKVVDNYFARLKVIDGQRANTPNSTGTIIAEFMVSVIAAFDRHSLGTPNEVKKIYSGYFDGTDDISSMRRSFIFDITSEFRLRLGVERYNNFVDELAESYSMVDYDSYVNNDNLTVIEGLNATGLSFPRKAMRDNPWFVSFLLLSTVTIN